MTTQEKIDFSFVPESYIMCLNRECLKADTCLRQIVERDISEEIAYWSIISPKLLANLKGDCPYYRSSQKVRYARGFINILENLSKKQARAVVPHLMRSFGRTHYYRLRKGERLLSPTDQQKVLSALKNCGASHLQEFDKYEEKYDW